MTVQMIRRMCGGRHRSRSRGGIPMIRWTRSALVVLSLVTTTVTAQQPSASTGTVVGQVIATASREPLMGAEVSIVGTTLRAGVGAEGRFTLRNVPVGAHTV